MFGNEEQYKIKRELTNKDDINRVNAIIIIKLSNCLSTKDQILLQTITEVRDIITKLRAKYYDSAPTKNRKLIREFHNYQLDKKELVIYI